MPEPQTSGAAHWSIRLDRDLPGSTLTVRSAFDFGSVAGDVRFCASAKLFTSGAPDIRPPPRSPEVEPRASRGFRQGDAVVLSLHAGSLLERIRIARRVLDGTCGASLTGKPLAQGARIVGAVRPWVHAERDVQELLLGEFAILFASDDRAGEVVGSSDA